MRLVIVSLLLLLLVDKRLYNLKIFTVTMLIDLIIRKQNIIKKITEKICVDNNV